MSKATKKKHKIKRGKNIQPKPGDRGKKFFLFVEKLSSLQFNTLSILIIILTGFLAYSNTFRGEMIFDDINIIQQNENIHDFNEFKNLNSWFNLNSRHFCMLTFALNYSIHENEVFGYHIVNLLIHLIFGILIFLLMKLILKVRLYDNDPQRKYPGLLAFFIALVCVMHPIQTQAVSYIVQRMASMAAMFYVASVFFYAKGRLLYSNNGLNFKVFTLYFFSLLFGIIGLQTKQTVITLPAAILLFELFFIRKKHGGIYKHYLITAFSLLAVFLLVVIFGGYLPKETDTITRSEYLYTQSRVILKYIQLILIPINQALDYDFSISHSFFSWKVILSSLVIGGMFLIAVFSYKKKHLVSFGILWFFITLSAESSIIPIRDVINEHRLYLPLVGFSLVFISLIWDYFSKKSLIGVIFFFVILNTIYGFATYEQNKTWHSKLSLWRNNTAKKPHNSRSHNNLGSTYITLNDFENAEDSYEKAVKLKPDYIEALFNLGNVKIDLGKFTEAVKVLNQLIKEDSAFYKAYFARGIAYSSMQIYDKALSDFSKAISDKDIENNIKVFNKSGMVKFSMNKYTEAIEDFNKALAIDSTFTETYNNLGLVYLESDNYDKAVYYFTKAIDYRPEFFEAYNNRGNAYFKQKNYEKALKEYKYALEINPDEITVLKNIALINYIIRNYQEAIEFYNKILEINPNSATVINDRGLTYYMMQDYERAYADLLRARQAGVITNQEVFDFIQNYVQNNKQ